MCRSRIFRRSTLLMTGHIYTTTHAANTQHTDFTVQFPLDLSLTMSSSSQNTTEHITLGLTCKDEFLEEATLDPYLNPVPSTSKATEEDPLQPASSQSSSGFGRQSPSPSEPTSPLSDSELGLVLGDPFTMGQSEGSEPSVSPPPALYSPPILVLSSPDPSPPRSVEAVQNFLQASRRTMDQTCFLLPRAGASDMGAIGALHHPPPINAQHPRLPSSSHLPTLQRSPMAASGYPANQLATPSPPQPTIIVCVLCGATLPSTRMREHMVVSHSIDPAKLPQAACHICRFPTLLASLGTHLAYVHDTKMVASEYVLPLAVNIKALAHNTHISNSYLCKICGNACNSPIDLMRHMRDHAVPVTQMCGVCHNQYISKTHMLRHKARANHDGSACSSCGLAFDDKVTRDKHQELGRCRCHCLTCGSSYRYISTLSKHYRDKHPILFWCERCGLGSHSRELHEEHTCG